MMVFFDAEAAVDLGAVRTGSSVTLSRLDCVPGQLSCIVLSADASVRRRLEAATELAGWSICDAPVDGVDFEDVSVRDFQLVIVDLANPIDGDLAFAQTAAERIASRPETLLVVCGDDDSDAHEIWSRCQGAYCHLSGNVSGDALVSLFNKARASAHRHTSRAVRCRI